MPEPSFYRLPSKLKKFQIDDPFLQLIVAKYENEIPWQRTVRDSETLIDFIEKEMYPKLIKRLTYPIAKDTRHIFLRADEIQLDRALGEWTRILTTQQRSKINKIREERGDQAATDELTHLLNQRKHRAFKSWINLFDQEYSHTRAFALLILRPLIERHPKGVRRMPAKPSPKAIRWLYRQIEGQLVSPNDNLARVYFHKLACRNDRDRIYEWTFIGSFSDTAELTAAAYGSGWCISSADWAENYEMDCFFILRHCGRPVVAIRIDDDFENVLEIQGVFNTTPELWYDEIDLLIQTFQFEMDCCYDEGFLDEQRDQRELNRIDKPIEWWHSQVQKWPFSILAATEEYFAPLLPEVMKQLPFFIHVPDFPIFCERLGVELSMEDWCNAIRTEPSSFMYCPKIFRNDPTIELAQTQGWCELFTDGFIDLRTIGEVPEHIFADQQFKNTVLANRANLHEIIRQNPRSKKEREGRRLLVELIGLDESSTPEMVKEWAIHHILANETGVYLKDQFPGEVREHAAFESIYRSAWVEAISVHPPLMVAMPAEFRDYEPPLKERNDVDLEKWCQAVLIRPWLLTQKNGTPKTIRLHPKIIAAYVEGWKVYLRKSPNKIWVKRGMGRVYMSYALLADDTVIEALTDGWVRKIKSIARSWKSASERMRRLPSFQVSVLRAIIHCAKVDTGKSICISSSQMSVVNEIATFYTCGDISAEPKMLTEIKDLLDTVDPWPPKRLVDGRLM
jgi:hypothetical protein